MDGQPGQSNGSMTPQGRFRPFSETVEAVARLWRETIVSSENWRDTETFPHKQGEAGGRFVTSGPVNGYIKPGRSEPNNRRAACEKICSDLGYDFGLPVPPAVLYRRPTADPKVERLTAVMLVCFDGVYQWGEIKSQEDRKARFVRALSPVVSAMIPFGTWVGNQDRVNDGNLIVSEDPAGNGNVLRWAYIDFAYSLVYDWQEPQRRISFQHDCCFP
jgi:hypothetical protein